MYYNEQHQQQQRLGFNEFREVVLDNISRLVVNESYMTNNENAFENIVFKSYEQYANSKTENYTINQIVSLLNIFLDSLIKYAMDNELPEDVITIS